MFSILQVIAKWLALMRLFVNTTWQFYDTLATESDWFTRDSQDPSRKYFEKRKAADFSKFILDHTCSLVHCRIRYFGSPHSRWVCAYCDIDIYTIFAYKNTYIHIKIAAIQRVCAISCRRVNKNNRVARSLALGLIQFGLQKQRNRKEKRQSRSNCACFGVFPQSRANLSHGSLAV